ncbi:histidinol-phosphatase [Tsukamurella soli]|uniref:Histidinol-phosphatase n=1 Tax=Tsukamurella soli TaxID=644556 RepID=A0ABP8KCA5_9ACTN
MTADREWPGDLGRFGDLDLAHGLADAADRITTERFGAQDLRIDTKPDHTPVTDADRAVERRVRDLIARARPGDAVHGEEFEDTGIGDRRWIIDPIDGTKNFLRGVPVWATLIALTVGDEVDTAMVSAPALGRRWWAVRGHGAFGRDDRLAPSPRRLTVSTIAGLGDASVSYSSLGGWRDRGRRDGFLRLLESTWRQRAFGDFWSYMMVAEGLVDIAAEPDVPLYDLAAVSLIVTESGGTFTDLDGAPGPGGGSAVATNTLLHAAVLDQLRP